MMDAPSAEKKKAHLVVVAGSLQGSFWSCIEVNGGQLPFRRGGSKSGAQAKARTQWSLADWGKRAGSSCLRVDMVSAAMVRARRMREMEPSSPEEEVEATGEGERSSWRDEAGVSWELKEQGNVGSLQENEPNLLSRCPVRCN